jgi:hypothetical protein
MEQIPLPPRPRQKRFYRYSSLQPPRIEWLKKILLKHELYVPSATELNDPRDCRPKIAKMTKEETVDYLYRSTFNPTLSTKAHHDRLDELQKRIDGLPLETIQRLMTKALHRETEGFRIYSMSKRYDNMAMWAKYADDHKGYCLEIESNGPFESVVEVLYEEAMPIDPRTMRQSDRQNFATFLYYKNPDWRSEEEVRLILARKSGPILKIQPDNINRIILGMNISEENQKTIFDWAMRRQPPLRVVKAHFDSFNQQLKLTPLQLPELTW